MNWLLQRRHQRFSLLVMALIFTGTVTRSQPTSREPYHINIGLEQGLLSKNVIALFTDSKHTLWIGTDRGLQSFNGSKLTSYSNAGITENPLILAIDEDTSGNIWVCTYGNDIYQLENGEFRPHPSQGLQGWDRIAFSQVNSMEVFGPDSIILNSGRGGVMVTTDSISFMHLNGESYAHFEKKGSNLLGYVNWNNWPDGKAELIWNDTVFDLYPRMSIDDQEHFLLWMSFTAASDSAFVVISGRHGFHWDGTTLHEFKLPSVASNSILIRNRHEFLVGTEDNGLFWFKSGQQKAQLFEGQMVLDIEFDYEGGMWVATYEDGLLYLPNPAVRINTLDQYKVSEEILTLYKTTHGLVKLNGDFTLYVNDRLLLQLPHAEKKRGSFVPKLFQNADKTGYSYIYRTGQFRQGIIDWNELEAREWLSKKVILSMLPIGNDTIAGNYGFLEYYSKGKTWKLSSAENPYKRIRSIHWYKQDSLMFWINSTKGVHLLQIDTASKKTQELATALEGHWVERIWPYNGHVLIATKGKRSYLLPAPRKEPLAIDSLGDLEIFSMSEYRDEAFLATSKGLIWLYVDGLTSEYRCKNLSRALGIRPLVTNDVLVVDDTIFLATSDGLISVSVSRALSARSPVVELEVAQIRRNGMPWLKGTSPALRNDDNIKITVNTVGYKIDDHKYKYRLLPLDSHWRSTSDNELLFFNLPQREYQLQLKSPTGELYVQTFEVKAYVTQQWWFLMIMGILLMAVLGLPFFLSRKWKHDRLRLEEEQSTVKLRWLTSQLNPHFVFNSLTSIQAYILTNDIEASSNYLAKFARHIRNTLEQSNRSKVKLGEALTSMTTYLELERLRLSHKFNFDIELKGAADIKNVEVPVMLMQPYVENAVFHGMAHSKGGGSIKVVVDGSVESGIYIAIIDNGKEITPKELQDALGKGYGTKINRERARLLQTIGKENIEIKTESNFPERGVTTTIYIHPKS